MSDPVISASKFLSLVLRHQPELIGLELDAGGWADIDALIRLAHPRMALSRALIERAVAENDKRRFAISTDGLRIRARQGHSIAVDLDLPASMPPARLYHGTASRFVDAIRREGLNRRGRQYVHLSMDAQTARKVGARHGAAVVLTVRAAEMAADGHAFFLSENGVWLTAMVPSRYLDDEEV